MKIIGYKVSFALCTLIAVTAPVRAQNQIERYNAAMAHAASQVTLSVPAGGAASSSTFGPEGDPAIGYAMGTINSGSAPHGTAVFSFMQNGITVSEAGVPASPPTTSARIFIDYRSDVRAVPARSDSGTIDINTGLAVVNPGSATANVAYTLRNMSGDTLSVGHGTIDAGSHFACFIDQLKESAAPDFNLPADFRNTIQFGSLEITSDQPLSVLAIRGTNSQRDEFLITTTPTADLTQSRGNGTIFFPQFVDGGGYTTSLILMNTSDTTETGLFRIGDSVGAGLTVNPVEGNTGSFFDYSIPPHGVFRFQTDGSPDDGRVGWVWLIPDAGPTPVGLCVFLYNPGNILVTDSGVPAAMATTHARVYVDLRENRNTGLAITNIVGLGTRITVNAFESDGTTGIGTSLGPLQLHAFGHDARFVNQLVAGLPEGFTGVLDISSITPFAALTVRSLYNERGDFLITTFPLADVNQAAPAPIVFPQIAGGGGYVTQFIFISPSGAASTTLNFYGQDGAPLEVIP